LRALRALFLAVGGAVGVAYPFIAVILLGRGFDVVGVGIVTALSAVAFTASVPIWGHVADVLLGRPRALQVSAIGGGLALAVTLLPVPPITVAICFIVFSAFESAFAPLSDAVAVNGVPDARRDYARVRLMSSLSFGVAAILAGLVYDQLGYAPMPVLFGLAALVVVGSAAFVPDVERADLREMAPTTRGTDPAIGVPPPRSPALPSSAGASPISSVRFGSVGVALAIAPRLPLALLAIGLIHVGILAGFTFLSVRLQQLGAEPSAIALSAGVSAFAEIPAFLIMGGLAQRFGIRVVFLGATSIYTACFVSWTVLDSPILIIATRIATGFGFAGIGVAAVLTIATLLPDRLQGTGQSLYQTTAFGLAAIIANVGGGLVYGADGYAAVFGLAAIAGLLAMVVGLVALPRGRVRLATAPRAG
jgi:PPP family 3-phenylpropionic acid transporter